MEEGRDGEHKERDVMERKGGRGRGKECKSRKEGEVTEREDERGEELEGKGVRKKEERRKEY